MQCIYAEKFDVGLKIAIALNGGLDTSAGPVTLANVEKKKDKLRDLKTDGRININADGTPIVVTWGQGHMGELWQAKDYDPEYANWTKLPLPFLPEEHKVKVREGVDYKTRKKTGEPDPFAERQLKIIERCFRKADDIIIATDDDREGDLIAYYVFKLLDMNVPYERMLLDSMTEGGIKEAYRNRVDGSERRGIVAAGRCRAIADLDVGANLTVAATLTYANNLGLKLVSVGRIQTAVLSFIVEREKAIRDFVSVPFWTISGQFTLPNGSKYTGVTERFDKKEDCQNAVASFAGQKGQITKLKTTPTTSKVPILFNLADLQINANRYLGISAAKTLELAQSLYDKGFISYPRTASRHLTDDMKPKVDTYLDNLSRNPTYAKWIPARGDRKYTKRHFDTSKVESHYAICITESIPDLGKLNDLEAKIYDMIAKSIIRIAHEDALIDKTSVETTVNGVVFKTSGQKVKKPGWMVVSDAARKDVLLPEMSLNDLVDGVYEMKEGATEPPKRYTEATLLTAMQTCSKEIDDTKLKAILKDKNDGGIGRPSTQANIIQTVVTRYCRLEKKSIVPTESAMALMDALPVADLKSPEITASWEAKLDAVEKRTMSPSVFLDEIADSVEKWTEQILSSKAATVASAQMGTGMVCPKCGKNLVFTKKGGLTCKGFFDSTCDFGVYGVICGKKLTKNQLIDLITKGKTSEIKNFKSKAGTPFNARLVLKDDYTVGFEFQNKKKSKYRGKG